MGRHLRGDIDGLRAVAVLGVVLFHAGVPGVSGGFAGVDVFYVISGFLITGLLRAELPRGARALPGFWARRARRLLPAASLVLVTTAVSSLLLLPRLTARTAMVDGLWSAGWAANIRFALLQTDYLRGTSGLSPYQHWWSLGLEEQFYLLWPLLLLLSGVRKIPVMAVALVSFVVSVVYTRVDQPLAFFLLPSRAWELAVGALALLLPLRSPRLGATAGWVGLLAVLTSYTVLNESAAYPGWKAAGPVLGTALVLTGPYRGGPALLLDRWLPRVLGRASYSWYLWHWPLLVLLPARSLPGRLGLTVGALVLALLTQHFVEDPVRRSDRLAPPLRGLSLGGALAAASALTCLAVLLLATVPSGRGSTPTLAPLASGNGATPTVRRVGAAPRHHVVTPRPAQDILLAQAQAAVADGLRHRPVPRGLRPSLGQASADKALPFVDGCNLAFRDSEPATCAYGDTSSPRRVVLFGDSHATQWWPALVDLSGQHHWRLESLTKATCPPMPLALRSPVLGRAFTECTDFRVAVLRRILRERPALVVLGSARHYNDEYGIRVYGQPWLTAWGTLVHDLVKDGIPVVVMGATPLANGDAPTCLLEHLGDVVGCAVPRPQALSAAGGAAERAVIEAAGGHYVDVGSWLCTRAACPAVIGDVLVHRDDNHLTPEVVRWLEPLLDRVVPSCLHSQRAPACL